MGAYLVGWTEALGMTVAHALWPARTIHAYWTWGDSGSPRRCTPRRTFTEV